MTRKELQLSLITNLRKYVYRNNIIWGVTNDDKIVCHHLIKEKDWAYKTYYEADTPPFISCPTTFFLDTQGPINIQWRSKCIERNENLIKMRQKIKAFWTLRKEDEDVIITLNQNADIGKRYGDTEVELVMTYLSPLAGRYNKNRRLYLVPIRLIKNVRIARKDQ